MLLLTAVLAISGAGLVHFQGKGKPVSAWRNPPSCARWSGGAATGPSGTSNARTAIYGREAPALSILLRNEASFLTSSRITSALANRDGLRLIPSALSDPTAKFLVIRAKPSLDASNRPFTLRVS